MKKKIFIAGLVSTLIPLSAIVTLLVWAYRYIWFVNETVPLDRVGIAFLIAIFGCMLPAILLAIGEEK